ncbi:beta-hydroxyacyl-ACP dehydratase [Planctomycetales bacterium ZRK34]|nr:beta-hydroxyacyl-ACP dehydratase [Planctomycetales bacterium ZRK34]
MRWCWIDRILVLDKGARCVAIKNVSLAEEHLHDHFPGTPVVPASLMIEGMAQTAGILTGHARGFKEKVILAKIGKAQFDCEVYPGQSLIYDATLDRIDEAGASTTGIVRLIDHAAPTRPHAEQSEASDAPLWQTAPQIGVIELMFSHIDKNMRGLGFPEHNFVFTDQFMNLLKNSGFDPGS